MPVICPYCKNPAVLVTGATIYPHRPDLHGKHFFACEPCDAWVGCHPNTKSPMGRLANLELRQWKMRVHSAFDPHWRGKGKGSRGASYRRLAYAMGITLQECHIGKFDVPQCFDALKIIQGWGEP